MSVTAVVGCGWGDEGKGKIVDALAAERSARLVIRFNGGPNAGHTVVPEVDGADKPARIGLRLGDLLDEQYLADYLPFLLQEQNRRLTGADVEPMKLAELVNLCERWAEALRERIVDPYPLVRDALKSGAPIILEGQL